MSSQHDMAPVLPTVQRWQRYGYDRAYVEIDGRSLGYRDLGTGLVRSYDPANLAIIETVTSDMLEPVPSPGRHALPGDDESELRAQSSYVARHAVAEVGARCASPTLRKRTSRATSR